MRFQTFSYKCKQNYFVYLSCSLTSQIGNLTKRDFDHSTCSSLAPFGIWGADSLFQDFKPFFNNLLIDDILASDWLAVLRWVKWVPGFFCNWPSTSLLKVCFPHLLTSLFHNYRPDSPTLASNCLHISALNQFFSSFQVLMRLWPLPIRSMPAPWKNLREKACFFNIFSIVRRSDNKTSLLHM